MANQRDSETPGPAFWLQVRLLRLLGWSNGLEGWLSLMATCWGLSLLVYPSYWTQTWSAYRSEWPITPIHMAWVLTISGALGLGSMKTRSRHWRMQTSVLAFIAWACLAVYDLAVPPLPLVQAFVMHSLIAIAELGVYVRILIGFDSKTSQLASYIERPTDKDDGAWKS
jgi:hypothetical protein